MIDSLNEQDLIKEIKNKMYFLLYNEYEINLLKEEFKTMDNDKKLSLIASLKNELKRDANITVEIESKESEESKNNNNIYSISEIIDFRFKSVPAVENFISDLDKKLKTEENNFSHIYKEVIDNKIKIYENKDILTILKEIFPDEEIDIKQFKEKLEEDGVSETFESLYNLIQEILGTEECNVIYNFDGFMEIFSNFEIIRNEFRNYYLYKKRMLIIKECLLNDLKCFTEKMEKEKLEYLNEIILESKNNSRINSIFISNDKIVIHIDNYIKFYDLKNYSLITNIKIDLNSSIIKLKNGDIMCKNIFETYCLVIKKTNLKIKKKCLYFQMDFISY